LLGRHFEIISEGGEIDIPKFDFRRQKRSPQIYERLRLTGREVMIVEGIHAHNPQIIGHQPKAVRIFVSTSPNARLVRRMIRDNNFRGASASYTYSLWANVRKNEEENILPLRPNADIDIDTTLLYEPGVLKPFVEDLFSRPETDGNFRKAREDILAEFSKYEAIPEKYLPPTSLLREFIGGSSYKY
ncbi:MAG: uridine kinase family protein, partial [Oscillospiraceae bacterium]